MLRTERNWVLSKSHSEFNETIYNISLVLLNDEMHYFSCIIFLSVPTGRLLVSPPGIEPVPLEVEAWSLNHWTTREVP